MLEGLNSATAMTEFLSEEKERAFDYGENKYYLLASLYRECLVYRLWIGGRERIEGGEESRTMGETERWWFEIAVWGHENDTSAIKVK